MGAAPGAPATSWWIDSKCAVIREPGETVGIPTASLPFARSLPSASCADERAPLDASCGLTMNVLASTVCSRPRSGEAGPARIASASAGSVNEASSMSSRSLSQVAI